MGANSQHFVSPYLTHFVGRRFADQDSAQYLDSPERERAQYNVLAAILRSEHLGEHGEGFLGYGVGMNVQLCSNDMFRVSAVCFCDIPLDDLGVHMGKYGEFGLCFPKRFLIDRGASPVFYVAMNAATHRVTTRGGYFNEMGGLYGLMHAFLWSRGTRPHDVEDPDLHELLRTHPELRTHGAVTRLRDKLDALVQFLDAYMFGYVKCFDDRLPEDSVSNYYMEREWRAPLRVAFKLENVACVVVPRTYAQRFHEDFPGVPAERIRQAEDCRHRA